MEMSKLLLQNGASYHLWSNNDIDYSIKNPLLKDILELEKKEKGLYYEYLYVLTNSSLDVADVLFCEANIWYEDIKSEWEFFLRKIVSSDLKSQKGLVTITKGKFKTEIIEDCYVVNEIYRDALNFFLNTNGEYILYGSTNIEEAENIVLLNIKEKQIKNGEECLIIDDTAFKFTEHFYYITMDVLRMMNWIKPEYDFLKGGTKYAKKYILKQNYKDRNKKKQPNVDLSSIISALVAKGQRYADLLDYSIYFIYELYYRYIKIDEWDNTMMALNGGNIDTKKHPIDFEKINWANIIT